MSKRDPIPEYVSMAALARFLDASPRTIRRAIDDGMPAERKAQRGVEVRIPFADAVAWWYRQEAERRMPSTGSRDDEELRLISARANKIEAEDALLRRESCRVEDARQAMLGLGSVVVSEFGSLPGRLAHLADEVADPAALREAVDDEVRRVRARIADTLDASVARIEEQDDG